MTRPGRPRAKPRVIDWSSAPDILSTGDVVRLSGLSWFRVREAQRNLSLRGSCVGRHWRHTKDDVRAFVEPDLTAATLTIDAAAQVARARPRQIEAAIKAGALPATNNSVKRADVIAWVSKGGAA